MCTVASQHVRARFSHRDITRRQSEPNAEKQETPQRLTNSLDRPAGRHLGIVRFWREGRWQTVLKAGH